MEISREIKNLSIPSFIVEISKNASTFKWSNNKNHLSSTIGKQR